MIVYTIVENLTQNIAYRDNNGGNDTLVKTTVITLEGDIIR